jgi:hypothetical protein
MKTVNRGHLGRMIKRMIKRGELEMRHRRVGTRLRPVVRVVRRVEIVNDGERLHVYVGSMRSHGSESLDCWAGIGAFIVGSFGIDEITGKDNGLFPS